MELFAVDSDLKLLALELERPVKKVRFVPSSSESPSFPPPHRGAWRCASRWRLGAWYRFRLSGDGRVVLLGHAMATRARG